MRLLLFLLLSSLLLVHGEEEEELINESSLSSGGEHVCLNADGSQGSCSNNDSATAKDPFEPEEATNNPHDSTTTSTTTTDSSSSDDPITFTRSYGPEQTVAGPRALETMERIVQVNIYLKKLLQENPEYYKTSCRNNHADCSFWAAIGECDKNIMYMHLHCGPACMSCDRDNHGSTAAYRTLLDDESKLSLEEEAQAAIDFTTAYGDRQTVDEGNYKDVTLQRIMFVNRYMRETVYAETKYDQVREHCRNRHEQCAFWAVIGECENNPSYMTLQCAPSCYTCDKLDHKVRCPFDPDAPKAWDKEGDLYAFFERITTEPYYVENYQPQILSHPGEENEHNPGKTAPWVVVLDSFLTQEECETLIRLGGEQGYERSEDVGEANFDGTLSGVQSEGRTSTNAWCLDACYDDPVTQGVLRKLENLTGIPDANSEYLQLLRYEESQFYESHHDYISQHKGSRSYGPRILTVFLYLNDVEAGGGTRFTDLQMTVMPKRGRALLWPSVRNDNPMEIDLLTHHQALPVERGIKYGANAWVHQRDFKKPYKEGCT